MFQHKKKLFNLNYFAPRQANRPAQSVAKEYHAQPHSQPHSFARQQNKNSINEKKEKKLFILGEKNSFFNKRQQKIFGAKKHVNE